MSDKAGFGYFTKRQAKMTYEKPEIIALGIAVKIICCEKCNFWLVDGLYSTPAPAYGLDEE